MIGIAPVYHRNDQQLTRARRGLKHTHSDTDTEQPANDLVNNAVQLFITRFGAVNLPICVVA
jgi:hypothetical protein